VNVGVVLHIPADTNYIEPARWPAISKMLLEKKAGGANQLALLGMRDGRRRAAMIRTGSIPYFDKNQHLLIFHNQVDFASFALEVAIAIAEPSVA